MAAGEQNCRLCGAALSAQTPLRFDRAPAGAQHFLDAADQPNQSDTITLTILECLECGLVQSSAPPVAYYRNVITAAGVSAAMRAHRLAQVKAFAAAYDLAGKSVVEIGTHNGYFLDILAQAELKPHGTEPGGATNAATSHPIIDFYPEPGATIRGGPFAAFFCLNFLEHAPDPRAFLGGIRENLTVDGVGLVEVPNYGQQRRLGRVFDYIVDHLAYYDAATFRCVLMLSGFVVERLEETRGGENLEAWVRRRGSADLAQEAAAIRRTRDELNRWLAQQRTADKRVAIWGASHQALTLLGEIGGTGLVGIFDSAPFKQGRYAPVTRLPVLKPTRETLQTADVILIIAAGYEKEIAANLRAQFAFAGEVFQMENGSAVPMES